MLSTVKRIGPLPDSACSWWHGKGFRVQGLGFAVWGSRLQDFSSRPFRLDASAAAGTVKRSIAYSQVRMTIPG